MKKLIGGAALVKLGSSRHTEDTDYLVYDESSSDIFIHDSTTNTDYVNAAASEFLAVIWDAEKAVVSEMAAPQSLLLLKAWAFVSHCQNGFWQKADDSEYDIKFLVRNFDVTDISLLVGVISPAEIKEIQKIIDSVKR